MNQELIRDLAISLIKSGIGLAKQFESKHVKDCRELISMYNETPVRPEPEIKSKLLSILADMQIKPSEADVISLMAKIQKLYIEDYM